MFNELKGLRSVADAYVQMTEAVHGTIPIQVKSGPSKTGECDSCEETDKLAKIVAKGQTAAVCQTCLDGIRDHGGNKLTQDEFDSIFPVPGKIEAHGVKGLKNTSWRKTFPSRKALNAWAAKNEADVHGTRNVEEGMTTKVLEYEE